VDPGGRWVKSLDRSPAGADPSKLETMEEDRIRSSPWAAYKATTSPRIRASLTSAM